MANQIGVWLDGTKAVVVKPVTGTITEVLANIDNKVHHGGEGKRSAPVRGMQVNLEKKFDERKKHQTHDYLKDVISELKAADEIYVFGPSKMKTNLKAEILKDKVLKDKLRGVESADSLTNNQIVAAVKKYFSLEKKIPAKSAIKRAVAKKQAAKKLAPKKAVVKKKNNR
jgi:hypothetical protein